jgi:hypothetical protein
MSESAIFSLVGQTSFQLNKTHSFLAGPLYASALQLNDTDCYCYVRFNNGFTPKELIEQHMIGWEFNEDPVRHKKWHGKNATWFDVLTNKITVDRSSVGNALYLVLNLAAKGESNSSGKNYADIDGWSRKQRDQSVNGNLNTLDQYQGNQHLAYNQSNIHYGGNINDINQLNLQYSGSNQFGIDIPNAKQLNMQFTGSNQLGYNQLINAQNSNGMLPMNQMQGYYDSFGTTNNVQMDMNNQQLKMNLMRNDYQMNNQMIITNQIQGLMNNMNHLQANRNSMSPMQGNMDHMNMFQGNMRPINNMQGNVTQTQGIQNNVLRNGNSEFHTQPYKYN